MAPWCRTWEAARPIPIENSDRTLAHVRFQAVDEQRAAVGPDSKPARGTRGMREHSSNARNRLLSLNPTKEVGLLTGLLRRLHAGPPCPRRARPSAALLAVVWILPGVWCTAQIVDHQLESDHPEEHLVMSSGSRICGMSHDHGHRHSHPDSSPVVSTEGAKKVNASALAGSAVAQDPSVASFRWHILSHLGSLAQRDQFASGPRAPPIS